ncbi:hypothetical protein PHYSODRAFT_338383 [Phytophthora sojae]|uniref:Uncharacterized protein n=1 Tax=Phytophthora sojae (strain P6497) TaxID=1094619 RepID=G5A4L5_PHYSP|nr:hypothetical protein PHYSODRAFT_338383 [Phytophthora sojae]EGZ09616.1 hypothetical protein PHYSODRAFT_338383 [Phytophthora sojae]|eukprot:XP_009534477.1 hypothetical protein PHYSODRAFT_338383 [Phytophthora sojae]
MQQPREAALNRLPAAPHIAHPDAPTASPSQPDYQVLGLRRAALLPGLGLVVQRKHEDGHICNAGVERRKKVLKSFCNAFVAMALSSKTEPHSRDAACDGCQAIPHLVVCFLRSLAEEEKEALRHPSLFSLRRRSSLLTL